MRGAAVAADRRWRNVPVVRERDPRRAVRAVRLLCWLLVAGAPLALYVAEQTSNVRVRYKIEEVRSQHERLVEAERRLRIERAALEALPHVEARALHELGLVHPSADQVIVPKGALPHGSGRTRGKEDTGLR